jgi:hypothetical protein
MLDDTVHTGWKLVDLPRMTISVTHVSGSLFKFNLVTFSQFRSTVGYVTYIVGTRTGYT